MYLNVSVEKGETTTYHILLEREGSDSTWIVGCMMQNLLQSISVTDLTTRS